jgi:cytochrome P450
VDVAIDAGRLARYDEAASPLDKMLLVGQWLSTDWLGFFAELRAHRPVFTTPMFTFVTRYTDVIEVLAQNEVFAMGYERFEPILGGPHMFTCESAETNWAERGQLRALIPSADVDRVREIAGRCADEALDAAAERGRIDLVGGLFRPVMLRVCAEYFGVPGPDPDRLWRWVRAAVRDLVNYVDDPEIRAAALAAGAELRVYLRGLLEHTGDDVLGRLNTLPAAMGLSAERRTVNAAFLPIGFLESGTASSANLVEQLLLRPSIREAAAAASGSPDFDRYVWEALRFNPFLKVISRVCRNDYRLGGTVIPAGSLVMVSLASAMFDERAVDDPEEFRLDRPAHVRLHFGFGPHQCLGTHPGAAMIAEAVRRLLARPGVRSLPPPEGAFVRQGGFPERFVVGLGR